MGGRSIFAYAQARPDRFMPTAVVARGARAVPLPRRPGPVDVGDLHRCTATTAFVVLHRGHLVHEAYPGRFAGPHRRMAVFSLAKSVTSILVGAALADGTLGGLDDPVTRYRPDLRGTAYDGTTLRHLLDMCSGVAGPDDVIRRFAWAVLAGGDVTAMVRAAPRLFEPGARFNYSTFDAQVLGWVVEAAAGRSLAAYASERLWALIGAERDASYGLSRSRPRTVIGAGAFHATARDLARLGLMMAAGGVAGDRRVVPASWVCRSQDAGVPHLAVGALGEGGEPHYGYANQWWTLGDGRFTGLGAYGQYLWVDPAAEVVIVKCSAWPREWDATLDRVTVGALETVADHYRTNPHSAYRICR